MRKINAKGSMLLNAKKIVLIKNIDLECQDKDKMQICMFIVLKIQLLILNLEKFIHLIRHCSNGNVMINLVIINVKGGELSNSNSYAIYMPAFGEINISGGTSINMRRGNFEYLVVKFLKLLIKRRSR